MLVARWLLVIWSLAVTLDFFHCSSLVLFDDLPRLSLPAALDQCRDDCDCYFRHTPDPDRQTDSATQRNRPRPARTCQSSCVAVNALRTFTFQSVSTATSSKFLSVRLPAVGATDGQVGFTAPLPSKLNADRASDDATARQWSGQGKRGSIERRARLLTLTGGPTINQNDARVLSTPSTAPAVRGSGHFYPRTVPLATTKTLLTVPLTLKRTLMIKRYHWQVFAFNSGSDGKTSG